MASPIRAGLFYLLTDLVLFYNAPVIEAAAAICIVSTEDAVFRLDLNFSWFTYSDGHHTQPRIQWCQGVLNFS